MQKERIEKERRVANTVGWQHIKLVQGMRWVVITEYTVNENHDPYKVLFIDTFSCFVSRTQGVAISILRIERVRALCQHNSCRMGVRLLLFVKIELRPERKDKPVKVS